jgi:autophagy-related protein 18
MVDPQNTNSNPQAANHEIVISKSVSSIDEQVNCFSFNQDQSCLAVGLQSGFKIFKVSPLKLFYQKNVGPVSIVEMIYASSLIFFVGKSENTTYCRKRLTIWDTVDVKGPISEITYSQKIQSLKLNGEKMVISTKQKIYIYSLNNLTLLDELRVENTMGRLVFTPYM